jgi:hypothetical protein
MIAEAHRGPIVTAGNARGDFGLRDDRAVEHRGQGMARSIAACSFCALNTFGW